MQRAMRQLLESNPTLNVPKELVDVLGFSGEMNQKAKDDLYSQQRLLNARRKVTTKIDKLQQALTRKGLQMNAYKEEMKQKLAMELERFNKEKHEISEALEQAKLQLKKIESGEELDPIMEDPAMDTGGDTLAQLLGIQDIDQQEVERLKAEKTYAESMAAQLQMQVQMMMTAAASGTIPQPASMDQFLGAGSRMDSPQLPGLGNLPGMAGMQRTKNTERPTPYGKETKETKKANQNQNGQDTVELVMDSPELAKLDH